MKKRVLASISKNGSVVWNYDWSEMDTETMVRIQMLAEEIAHYQSMGISEVLDEIEAKAA
jgi:hypothetical protein